MPGLLHNLLFGFPTSLEIPSVNKISLVCQSYLGSWCDGLSQCSKLLFQLNLITHWHGITYAFYSQCPDFAHQVPCILECHCNLASTARVPPPPKLFSISTNFINPSPPSQTRIGVSSLFAPLSSSSSFYFYFYFWYI